MIAAPSRRTGSKPLVDRQQSPARRGRASDPPRRSPAARARRAMAKTSFCWLPPDSVSARRIRVACPDVMRWPALRGFVRRIGVPVEPPRRAIERAEQQVFGQGERRNQSFGGAILRNEPHRFGDVERSGNDLHVIDPGNGAQQFALAVSLDGGDADDFAGADRERGIVDRDGWRFAARFGRTAAAGRGDRPSPARPPPRPHVGRMPASRHRSSPGPTNAWSGSR